MDETRCIEQVWSDFRQHQCYKKRGHGRDGLYCKQHAKIHEERDKARYWEIPENREKIKLIEYELNNTVMGALYKEKAAHIERALTEIRDFTIWINRICGDDRVKFEPLDMEQVKIVFEQKLLGIRHYELYQQYLRERGW